MRFFALLACCVVIVQADLLKWEEFKKTHNKKYESTTEHDFRFRIFVQNLKEIIQHNKKFDEEKTTFKMGINQFTDLLSSEFSELMLTRSKHENNRVEAVILSKSDAPDSVDWRTEGAVTPVKDQGNCGSCWSFAATGGLEGQHFLKDGELVSLSEQNLIDCSQDYGNNGCGGGLEYDGWAYVRDNGGIDTEEGYPYQAKNGRCRFDESAIGANCTGFQKLAKGDENELKKSVATIGPISVGIDAEAGFQSYESGILKTDDCSKSELNHSVLVVGYGTEDGQDYWLVKNSWGTSYGEDGYIRMARNYNNMCGIASDASYPEV